MGAPGRLPGAVRRGAPLLPGCAGVVAYFLNEACSGLWAEPFLCGNINREVWDRVERQRVGAKGRGGTQDAPALMVFNCRSTLASFGEDETSPS